jgi:hypothetical protein
MTSLAKAVFATGALALMGPLVIAAAPHSTAETSRSLEERRQCTWFEKYYESPGGGVVCYGGSGSACVACKS